eukprot:scaffold202423_cov30-Tisochrysis_lutea.AAC.5
MGGRSCPPLSITDTPSVGLYNHPQPLPARRGLADIKSDVGARVVGALCHMGCDSAPASLRPSPLKGSARKVSSAFF